MLHSKGYFVRCMDSGDKDISSFVSKSMNPFDNPRYHAFLISKDKNLLTDYPCVINLDNNELLLINSMNKEDLPNNFGVIIESTLKDSFLNPMSSFLKNIIVSHNGIIEDIYIKFDPLQ